MTNRASSLITQGPVNWSEPLAKHYKEDEQDYDKYVGRVAQQGKEWLVAQEKTSLPKTIAKIATFSAAARKLQYTMKQADEKKKLEENSEIETKLALLGKEWTSDYNDLKELEWQKEKGKILDGKLDDHDAKIKELTTKLLRSDDPRQNAAAKDILGYSGRRLVYTQELTARHAVIGLSEDRMLEELGADDASIDDKKLLDNYINAKGSNDADGADKFFDKWRTSKLAHLNLNDKALVGVLGRELKRQGDTQRGISNATLATRLSTEQQVADYQHLKVSDAAGGLKQGIANLTDVLIKEGRFQKLEDGTTVTQQVNAYISDTLGDLAMDGYLPEGALASYTESGIQHPAAPDGKGTPKLNLSKEQVNDLVKKAKFGATRHIEVRKAEILSKMPGWKLAAMRGEDVSVQLNNAERLFPGMKEEINKIRNTKPADNTDGAYAAEKAQWMITYERGNIVEMKEQAKEIRNVKLKDEINAIIKQQEKIRKDVGYEERWLDVHVSKALDLTLAKGDPLDPKGLKVRNDLRLFFRKEFQRLATNDPTNPNIFNDAMTATENYWARNGGNAEKTSQGQKPTNIDTNNPPGKFTATTNGTFDNYDAYSGLVSQRYKHSQIIPNINDEQTYRNRVTNSIDFAKTDKETKGDNLVEKVINKKGSVLDAEDIVGAFENNSFSQEMILKAKQLGVTPFELLNAQYAALKADDTNNELRNLDESQINDFLKPGLAVVKTLKEAGANDLLYLINRVGMDNLSTNQIERIDNYLASVAYTKGAQKEQDDAREKALAVAKQVQKNQRELGPSLADPVKPGESYQPPIDPTGVFTEAPTVSGNNEPITEEEKELWEEQDKSATEQGLF